MKGETELIVKEDDRDSLSESEASSYENTKKRVEISVSSGGSPRKASPKKWSPKKVKPQVRTTNFALRE